MKRIDHQDGKKWCGDCGKWRELTDFYIQKSRWDKCSNCCKECTKVRSAKWNKAHPGDQKLKRLASPKEWEARDHRNGLKKNYGISVEEYNLMLDKQEGKCAICRKPETVERSGKLMRISVHHCHNTGRVIALLCHNCNNGLGRFQESVELLEAAARFQRQGGYVNNTGTGWF